MSNQHAPKWDQKKIASAVKCLGEVHHVEDALTAISSAVGFEVTEGMLRGAFKRAGDSPGRHLKPDPVQKRDLAVARASEKKAVEKLVDEVRELRRRQEYLDEIAARRTPKITPKERSGVREMTAVVLASDWHVEERVEPESVAGRNEYTLDIAARRVDRFFQAIAWHIEHQRASGRITIRDLVLWLGGDLMTGYIHEELVESNELSPTETILWLLPRLEGGIRGLLTRLELSRVVIPCSFGNHGRTTAKPRISTAYSNSFEWLMYHQLAMNLRDEKRIEFSITSSAHQYVDVYGQTLHFHHGDDVKYVGGIGGIAVPLLKAVPAWDLVRRADVHCVGHWHTLRDFGRAVVNGSLIGYGPFSQRIRAEIEDPQQALFYLDSKRGKTMMTHLWLTEGKK